MSRTCPQRSLWSFPPALVMLAVAVMLGSTPFTIEGQQKPRVFRVGILLPFAPARMPATGIFRQALRDLGYVEGHNVVFESRSIELDNLDQLPALAADLVRANVDVIFAVAGAAHAAKKATTTIPIVFAGVADPVGSGLATSLAHPGGNATGLTSTAADLSGKRLQLLKEMLPAVTRVAVLWNTNNPLVAPQVPETEAAARVLKIALHTVGIRTADDLESAFASMVSQRAGAVVVIADVLTTAHRETIAALAVKHRLPAISEFRDFAGAGGLVAYGPSPVDIARRAAVYADKILRGTKPADLPIQQPVTFDLVINLKTARTLGVTIPPALLLRADQTIE